MLVNKISIGFVIQTFDTEKKEYISQEFFSNDEVEYEDTEGDPVDPVAVGMQNENGEEKYLPFEMVQPDELDLIYANR
jgi:hypothetical protein